MKTTITILLQEALNLFDNGVPVLLSDRKTGANFNRTSAFDPIDDRDYLMQLCKENPDANLKVVTDKDRGLVAIGVGFGSFAQNGEESFKELTDKYGIPNTLSYHLPNGESYYLFKVGADDINLNVGSGAYYLDDPDDFLVYPSEIDNKPVIKQGSATNIMDLADWLSGKGFESQTVLEQPDNPVDEVHPAAEQEPSSSVPDVANVADFATSESISTEINTPTVYGDIHQQISFWKDAGVQHEEILSKALTWNLGQKVPLSTTDLVNMIEDTSDSDPIKPATEQPPTGKDLVRKLSEAIVPFHDEKREPYFFFEGEVFKAPSKAVADRLRYLYLKQTDHLPPKNDINEILDLLETKARFEGDQVNLKNRVSAKDQAIYYDLRDKRYLKITSEKWEIVSASFPLFRRYQHMQTQVEPVVGGDPWKVFDFLAVDAENRLIVMVYLISLFIPKIAHPVFALFGDQGASKSFFSSVINRLVDPTLTERIIQPKNESNLIQTVRQKYVTVLDNLSKIDNRVSDIFCQVCTGGSVSMRQLYTDEGENIAQFRHVVILNSISLAIVNADLMDRSIILKLHRIKPEDRKPEQDLWEAFEVERPGILGGIFDTVVKAMSIYHTLKINQLPRLADFAKWGYAIAEALGNSGNQFLDDFNQNIKRQNESVAEKNVLCQTVLRLMSDKQTYLKSVSDTHNALKAIAGADYKDATFPKLPHNLRNGLDVLRSTLVEHGITFDFLDRQNKGVRILLSKPASPATQPPNITFNAPIANFDNNFSVPGVPDEAGDAIQTFEVDEMPEVING